MLCIVSINKLIYLFMKIKTNVIYVHVDYLRCVVSVFLTLYFGHKILCKQMLFMVLVNGRW